MKSRKNLNIMDFHPYPTRQVVAVLDKPEHVAIALSQLERKGFAGGDIKILAGPEGARRLDASGSRHGLIGRLIRFLQGYGDMEQQTFASQAEELRAGHVLLGVHVHNAEERSFVARIFERCHGHFINYFGSWTIVGLAP